MRFSACQAPPPTPMHDVNLEKTPSLTAKTWGSEKWSPRCFERQKCLCCGAEKKKLAAPGTACKLGCGCLRGGSCIPCQRIQKKMFAKIARLHSQSGSQILTAWKIVEKLFHLRYGCRIQHQAAFLLRLRNLLQSNKDALCTNSSKACLILHALLDNINYLKMCWPSRCASCCIQLFAFSWQYL